MSKEEAIQKLKELQDSPDIEVAHLKADEILLDFINDPEIALEYNEIEKWYS